MKYLFVGLGNPGNEYANTRHNIGFMILDQLAAESKLSFSTKRHGDLAQMRIKGRQVYLLKPNTYMNLSGKAVRYWLNELKIDQSSMIVVTDDLAIPLGKIRFRKKGSSGGHNGMANIEEVLGNDNYNRLRIGIGNEFSKGKQVDYVLSDFNEEELALKEEVIKKSGEGLKAFPLIGMDRTMNQYNSKN